MTKLTESLSQWTEWTREHILPRPSLPLIDSEEIHRFSELHDVWGEGLDEIRESLETYLAQHYDDLAARFVVLSVLWELIRIEYGFKDLEAEKRSGFRMILKDLVCLVDPERLTDPKVISWEIVNACSVRAWDLGSQLYGRLKDTGPLNASQFRALRGQFLYLSADWEPRWRWSENEELDGPLSHWSPELQVEGLNSILICAWATVPPERHKEQPTQDQLARLQDAANDLKQAVDADPSVPLLLHLMLAKSSLMTGSHQLAGEEYEHVLRANLWKEWPADTPLLRQRLYECAANGYERAGRKEDAERALSECLGEVPNSKGISLRLAKLYTQPPQADYKAAYEALRREMEIDPSAGEDVRMSVALSLGAIGSEGHDLKRAVQEYLGRNPEQLDLTKSLIRANWSVFTSLSEQAQAEWAEASWMLWGLGSQLQIQPTGVYRRAAQTFGLAVECELRDRLFLRFRDHIKGAPRVIDTARQGLQDGSTREFCRFLLEGRHLMFGTMLKAFDDSTHHDTAGILRELSQYTSKSFPDLLSQFRKLDWRRLTRLYSPSKHELGGFSRVDAEQIHSMCRLFLSQLIGATTG